MAYYRKVEIFSFMKEALERAKKSEITIVVDPEEAARILGADGDLVAMFWVEQNKVEGSENLKLNVDGKVFVRIDYDLYSDDRYAIDSYQACKEGTTVSEIIKKRDLEAQETKNKLSEEETQRIKNSVESSDLFNKKPET
jgi:hypothetical protein